MAGRVGSVRANRSCYVSAAHPMRGVRVNRGPTAGGSPASTEVSRLREAARGISVTAPDMTGLTVGEAEEVLATLADFQRIERERGIGSGLIAAAKEIVRLRRDLRATLAVEESSP